MKGKKRGSKKEEGGRGESQRGEEHSHTLSYAAVGSILKTSKRLHLSSPFRLSASDFLFGFLLCLIPTLSSNRLSSKLQHTVIKSQINEQIAVYLQSTFWLGNA